MPGGFAIVLILEPGATAPQPPSWFRDYFLSKTFGVGAFWWKQSNGALQLQGDVFGWFTFPANVNYGDRDSIYWAMLQVANPQVVATQGTTIEQGYDRCIIFVALSPTGVGGTAAGSKPPPAAPPRPRRIGGYMIVDTNGSFAYIAHEMGHMLNLLHTFDQSNIKYAPWSQPGEYGHPYCIMSGRINAWTPDLSAVAALRGVGPCMNGLDACTAGLQSWIPNQVSWRPGVDPDLTIELESVGTWSGALQKVVRVKTGAHEFGIEYRNKQDYYDAGLPSSMVVINHGTGGRGRAAGMGATYIGEIRLPIVLGQQAGPTVFNSPHGFAVEVLDWKQTSVVLKIFNGRAKPVSVWPTVTIETGETNTVPMGTFDYTNAGVHCVTGVWNVTRVLRVQTATIEWNAPPWPQTFQTRWNVAGQDLTGPSGKISFFATVDSPFPLPNGTQRVQKAVELWFSINGSNQLKLANLQPENGNFSIDLHCEAPFTAAWLDWAGQVRFEGELLGHEPADDFETAFVACLIEERDRLRPQRVSWQFALPEPIEPRPPEELHHLSRDDLLEIFERLPADPLQASAARQLFHQITGVDPQRIQIREASATSAELPKEVTLCAPEPTGDDDNRMA